MLYDVNPGQFIANIAKFVTEVDKVDYLNLFINSLVDDEMGQELAFMRPKDKEEEIREEHKKFMSENIEGQK